MNWSNYFNTFTELTEDSKAVAALLKKIGDAVHMDYTPIGSGAEIRSPGAYDGLREFGYTSDPVTTDFGTVLPSILNHRPVLVGGTDRNSHMKHAWVICSYFKEVHQSCCDWDVYNDVTGEYLGVWTTQGIEDDIIISQWYHNWGWGGDYNGYYSTFIVNGYDFADFEIIPEIRVQ